MPVVVADTRPPNDLCLQVIPLLNIQSPPHLSGQRELRQATHLHQSHARILYTLNVRTQKSEFRNFVKEDGWDFSMRGRESGSPRCPGTDRPLRQMLS
jgi:hypothetical protein